VITLLSPPEHDELILPVSPTFRVQFADQADGELDSASLRVRLTTISSDSVTGTLTVDLAENRVSAVASLAVSDLAEGHYVLLAEGADMAGNRNSTAYSFSVTDTSTAPPVNPELGDSLVYNYPNPFSPLPGEGGGGTKFSVPASGGAMVQIKIYDFAGSFVRTVFDGPLPYTGYEPIWLAQNENGQQVASGVYLAHVRLTAGGETRQQIVKVAFRNKQ
jgi:hypothetical protein